MSYAAVRYRNAARKSGEDTTENDNFNKLWTGDADLRF